ncbi:MAG: MerR family transcriptional regulator [Beijerinckiaceae bacterium]
MSISEMVRLFNTTERTLRFYEARGLLAPPRQGQIRKYDLESRRRFRLVLEGRRLGFSLTQIAAMLSSVDGTDELMFTAEKLRDQIEILEDKHRKIEVALSDIRMRYYLMREVCAETDDETPDEQAGKTAAG